MNKIQDAIVGLEMEIERCQNPKNTKAYSKLEGIKFAQQEILKMIKALRTKHNDAWVLRELEKQIKGNGK